MITDVNSLSGYQFEWARWLPQGDNAHFGAHYIRVARQGDKQRSFATAGGNIVTFSRRITLFTLYKCMANCKINDHVEYEGNRYFVAGITENIPNSPRLFFSSGEASYPPSSPPSGITPSPR